MKLETLKNKLAYSRNEQSYWEAMKKISNKLDKYPSQITRKERDIIYTSTFKTWKNKKRNNQQEGN
jgi:hypothetical protein